jgi:hypothetical protein
VPVWHEATKQWVQEGKLVLLGVTQEQHPERCRLFAQWKRLDWPILHDPINVLESSAVPILTALDEHGIVRSSAPKLETFQADFLDQSFNNDATNTPVTPTPGVPPRFDELKAVVEKEDSATAWREYADALALWGGDGQLSHAIEAYREAARIRPNDGAAWFRLGVCLRRRFEADADASDDFRTAVLAWEKALGLDPNQYIWRRRIQQYGPRLDKPYPFYDWVAEAEQTIRERGETPVQLPVRPDGAEIAQPANSFVAQQQIPQNPDPQGKVARDVGAVACDIVVVPGTATRSRSARVHLTFRLAKKSREHWNNEADPLRVWVDTPDGTAASERLIVAEQPFSATSDEDRTVGFEVQINHADDGTITVPAFALFYLCDDADGQCRFVRKNITVEIPVK